MMLGSVGQTRGFGAGFLHPLFGLDHVLAMVAVGLWAGLAGGRQRLAVGLLRETDLARLIPRPTPTGGPVRKPSSPLTNRLEVEEQFS